MLTSYLVKCPHLGCHWFGSLLPRGKAEEWQGAVPSATIVVFECPECGGEWHARVRGDDVVPLPLPELAGQQA
jgi:hypothetical protein